MRMIEYRFDCAYVLNVFLSCTRTISRIISGTDIDQDAMLAISIPMDRAPVAIISIRKAQVLGNANDL